MRIGEGCVRNMDYIVFGRGERVLLLLPGLGDALRSMKGMSIPMAFLYRRFARDFRVYVFGRRRDLPAGTTTREMAAELREAMIELGIRKADVLGVSMGGMIAQWLAADAPELVETLILTVTCPQPNPILIEAVSEWVGFANAGDHRGLMESNLQRIYSPDYYRKNRWMLPLLGSLTKPKSYGNFLVQAQACLLHNAAAALEKIQAPTLVIGGEQDACLGAEASRELAKAIPGARLRMYPQWGHGLYEEEKGFQPLVLDFLLKGEC